jgi:hypothetical protein
MAATMAANTHSSGAYLYENHSDHYYLQMEPMPQGNFGMILTVLFM